MGHAEVYYVQRMTGLLIEEVMAMESALFYWILESLLEQEMGELDECSL